jgi:hypothetical protein
MSLTLAEADGLVLENEPLSRHTTWRIGGPARFFCRVRTEEGLAASLAAASRDALPLALLGMGSNVLAADDGFPGYVLKLEGDFLRVTIDGDRLTAGGGAALGGVCAAAARAGLSGIEAISGIPSSMGGAASGDPRPRPRFPTATAGRSSSRRARSSPARCSGSPRLTGSRSTRRRARSPTGAAARCRPSPTRAASSRTRTATTPAGSSRRAA